MDAEWLRQVMRDVPFAVTVVTVATDREVRGMTVGSFTSVSLEPPLISFNISGHASMHAVIGRAKHYAVHLLSDSQDHLSVLFSDPTRTAQERFADVSYDLDPNGVPILHGVAVVFRCVGYAIYPAGDHSLVVGRVVEARKRVGSDRPLLYFRQGYHHMGLRISEHPHPGG